MHSRTFVAAFLVTTLASALPAFAQGSDACATAQAIAGTGMFPFDNSTATTDGTPDPACTYFGFPDIAHDVWFAWTAPSTGAFTVTTCGLTGIDSKIAVLDGSCAGAVLACNDDACGSLQTTVSFGATAGNVYLLRVGTYPNAQGGTGSFNVGPFVPPDTRVNPANGHTYHLLDGGAWTAAESMAILLGGHLATVDDQAEHDWILAQWHNWQGVDVDLWIGFNDAAVEGTFVWADGTPVGYTNWDLNEPNDGGGIGEDYTAMRKNNPAAFWNDLADAPTGYHANPMAVVEVGGTVGTPLCFGDGSGTACPCGNNSAVGAEEGCLNSFSQGGKLVAAGSSSISNDTLALQGSQMPNSSALYFQGSSTTGGGAGVVFGDGLRCAGGSVVRLGTKSNSGGASQYPVGADPDVSVRGACAVGDVRTYQVWYRNAAVFCTSATFNLTNGLSITWNP